MSNLSRSNSIVPAQGSQSSDLRVGGHPRAGLSILDLFAGSGGWDVALKRMGLDPLGVEWDDAACATREAAGLRTLQGNVAELDPSGFGRVDLFIASPPCQAWSMAGKRLGEKDKEYVIACAHELAMGNDTRNIHGQECEDGRSMLVVEPIRFIRALRPTYVALEQVPPVLELWTLFATFLEQWGYSVWTGVLEAERYGVPQTRERAILIASLDGPVAPPEPTHQRYIPGEPQRHDITFEGEILPWVSMAEALGWHENVEMTNRMSLDNTANGPSFQTAERPCRTIDSTVSSWKGVNVPAPTVTAGGTGAGGPEPFGRGGRDRIMRANAQTNAAKRAADEPAPTITGGHDTGDRVWVENRPAPTIVTTRRSDQGIVVGRQLPEGEGRNVGGRNWTEERPATNVNCDPRIAPVGHHDNHMKDAVRVTEQEAAILQSFPPDYPFQGSRSKRFEQIGNAVPPLLAEAILRALLVAELRNTETEEKAA